MAPDGVVVLVGEQDRRVKVMQAASEWVRVPLDLFGHAVRASVLCALERRAGDALRDLRHMEGTRSAGIVDVAVPRR